MIDVAKVVVLGSSATALAIVRSLQRLGLAAVVADRARGVASRTRLATFHQLANGPPEQLAADLLPLREDRPTAVIADSDHWLRSLQPIRSPLEENGFVLMHAREPALSICLDKDRFSRWCATQGIPTPRHYPTDVDPDDPGLRYPLLLRPRQTCHERPREIPKAVEVASPAEFRREREVFRRGHVEPIVSESLLRPGIRCLSIGLARRNDGEIRSFCAERLRPAPESCAAGTYVRVCEHRAAQRLGERVATSLDLYGIAEVEVLVDDRRDETYVIEANARPWRQFSLADHSGHPLLSFLLHHPFADQPAVTRPGTAWLDFTSDLFVCFSRTHGMIRHGRLTIPEYLKSLCSVAFAGRSPNGSRQAVRERRPEPQAHAATRSSF